MKETLGNFKNNPTFETKNPIHAKMCVVNCGALSLRKNSNRQAMVLGLIKKDSVVSIISSCIEVDQDTWVKVITEEGREAFVMLYDGLKKLVYIVEV